MPSLWQPILQSDRLELRPLRESDFEALYAVGSDPLIWELHPEKTRYELEAFRAYFRSGIESGGAFLVLDRQNGQVIGSSRYTRHDPAKSAVEIGYTFLARAYWAKGYNRELKTLMLDHAFQFVDSVFFYVGEKNTRSRKAMLKLGATELEQIIRSPLQGSTYASVVYRMTKSEWAALNLPRLDTERMILEPVTEAHARELCELFSDPKLHQFVPLDPPTLEQQRERCSRWAKRRSPDGVELWLNWAGRLKSCCEVVAHFQAGVKQNGVASIGYLVGAANQRRGLATEGLRAIFSFLEKSMSIREIKAWVDTRNEASHRVAKKLGMVEVELIRGADFFKGSASDERVYSKSPVRLQ